MASVDELYTLSGKLSSAESEATKDPESYKAIIAAAKNEHVGAKKLVAQLIPKHFRSFPDLVVDSINAQFDLCEDPEPEVRIFAVRGLFGICKTVPEYTSKIVDVLSQMLTTTHQLELDAIRHTVVSLISLDAKSTLTGIFQRIIEPADEEMRTCLVNFVVDKIGAIAPTHLNPHPDIEKHLIEQIKKVMEDVSEEEFKKFFQLLKKLKVLSSPSSGKDLLQIISVQLDAVSDLTPERDGDPVHILTYLMNFSFPLYKSGGEPAVFFNYIQKSIVPFFSELSEGRKIALLKAIAETATYANNLTARGFIPSLFEIMMLYVPEVQPPSSSQAEAPKIEFSFLECLIYTFVVLASKNSIHLNALCGYPAVGAIQTEAEKAESAEKLKAFHARLRYLDSRVKIFIDQCKGALQKMPREKPEDLQKREAINTTLLSLQNITNTLKHLLHNTVQPMEKNAAFSFSWKTNAPPRTEVKQFKIASGELVKIVTKSTTETISKPASEATPNTSATVAKAITSNPFVSKTFQKALAPPQTTTAPSSTSSAPAITKRAIATESQRDKESKRPRGAYVPPGRR